MPLPKDWLTIPTHSLTGKLFVNLKESKSEMNKEEKRAYNKAYRKAHLEKIKAYRKAWYRANKEKMRRYSKARYEANREKLKAESKTYRETNPEKDKARKKVYREANREKIKAYRKANLEMGRKHCRKRQALKHTTQIEVINEKEVYLRDGWICQICHRRVNKNLKYPDPKSSSLDHIVPLTKGGTHTYKNVQLTHLVCNSGKKDRVLLQGEQMRLF